MAVSKQLWTRAVTEVERRVQAVTGIRLTIMSPQWRQPLCDPVYPITVPLIQFAGQETTAWNGSSIANLQLPFPPEKHRWPNFS